MTRQMALRAATIAAALFHFSCGLPPGQFIIVQDQVPSEGCVVPGDPSNLYRGQGTMDVHLVSDDARTGYLLFPLLQNNLQAPEGSQTGDPNRIVMSGFDVEIRSPQGAPPSVIKDYVDGLVAAPLGSADNGLVNYSLLWSGSLGSGGGYLAATVAAIPGELARQIRAKGVLSAKNYVYLTARVRGRGTLGSPSGTGVTSDPFDYPIRVCDGCLISSLQICPAMTAATNLGNVCNVAQDQAVDCCSTGTGLQCPPAGSH
jgi:hypothetical protein